MSRIGWIFILLVPLQVSAQNSHSQRLYRLGEFALAHGDLARAQGHFTRAVQADSTWGAAHLKLGMTLFEQDPHDRAALVQFQTATQLNPNNPRAHYYLGTCYAATENYDAARVHLEKATSLKPSFIDAWLRLADTYLALEDSALAIEAYRKILIYDPKHVSAHIALAGIYEQTGRLSAAEDTLKRLIQLYPQQAYYHYELAQFYDRLGERRKALRAHATAERIDPLRSKSMRTLQKSKK